MLNKNYIDILSLQLDLSKLKKEEYVQKFFQIVQTFKNRIIIFPESFPFIGRINYGDLNKIKKISIENNNMIFFGCDDKKKYYYCLYKNKIINHSKTLLFGDENVKLKKGKTLDIINFNGFNITPLVCYEFYFPQIPSILFDKDIDLIVYPTVIPLNRINFVTSLIKLRSAELNCDIVSSTFASKYSVAKNMVFRNSFKINTVMKVFCAGIGYNEYSLKKDKKIKISNERGSLLFKQKIYGPFSGDYKHKVSVLKWNI